MANQNEQTQKFKVMIDKKGSRVDTTQESKARPCLNLAIAKLDSQATLIFSMTCFLFNQSVYYYVGD